MMMTTPYPFHLVIMFPHLPLPSMHHSPAGSSPNNLRMAQGTECLHAIGNYMRKVKLKYQHVID